MTPAIAAQSRPYALLERAFTALGERLVRRGVVADLFVFGDAAMANAVAGERRDGRLAEKSLECDWRAGRRWMA